MNNKIAKTQVYQAWSISVSHSLFQKLITVLILAYSLT